MGYFCIDADAASVTAMDETNRRGANVAVRDQHPASAAFEQFAVDLILDVFGIEPARGAGHFTACGTEANHTAMVVALTDRLSQRNPRCRSYDPALCRTRPDGRSLTSTGATAACRSACGRRSMSRRRPMCRSRRTRAT